MNKLLLGVALVLTLPSCTTTSVGDARVSVSDFDGGKSVTIMPHKLVCSDYATCLTVGYHWSNEHADNAGVLVEINDSATGKYHPFISFKLNIDGEIITLKPHEGDKNNFDHKVTANLVTTKTSRLFTVPLNVLERVQLSNSTKFQIVSEGLVVEGDFKDSKENTRAYQAMIKFLEQVKSTK